MEDGQQVPPMGGGATKDGQNVKINIVNVHNEFNIQNNIIIQQPGGTDGPTNSGNPGG